MNAQKVTARQLQVLRFMFSFFQQNDQLPPMQVIATHFNWASANAADLHVKALRKHGMLEPNSLGWTKFTEAGRALATAPADAA